MKRMHSGRTIPRALSRLAVLVVLLGAACAGARDAGPTAGRPAAGRLAVEAAILRAEDRRMLDPELERAVGHEDPEIRARAARAVGRIGDAAGLPLLEAALGDADPSVRSSAAFALGLIGGEAAVPPLTRAAEDPDAGVRAAAASGLGLTETRGAQEALATLLADPEAAVAAAAAYGAARFEPGDFAVDALVANSRSTERPSSFAATYALSRLASVPTRLGYDARRRARARLAELADDMDPEVRRLVAKGFSVPADQEEAAVPAALLDDRDPYVRIAAVRSLAFPGAPLVPWIDEATRDPDPRILLAAIEGMARMKDPAVFDRLVEIAVRDGRPWVRARAAEALGAVDADRAAAIAPALSREEAPELRAAAARLVAGRRDDASIAVARGLLNDPAPEVRAAALAALSGAPGALEPLLGEALEGGQPVLERAGAARAAAARLGEPDRSEDERREAREILERLWRDADDDPQLLVAEEIVEAAAGAADDDDARTLLSSALDHPDFGVRRRAAEHWEERFDEDVLPRTLPAADRPLADYVEILRWAEQPRAATVIVQRPGYPFGRFTLRLDTETAPLAAHNFWTLAERGFYDGLPFHRIVPAFVVQGGDPLGNGEGGPGYSIRDEVSPGRFFIGTVGMASAGKDTAGSQWFVTLDEQPHLGGRYTAFGHVVQNFGGVVSALLPDDEIVSIEVYEGDGSEALGPLEP